MQVDPVLKQGLSLNGVWWSEYTAPRFLNFWHYTEVNGQIDGLNRFALGKESLASIRYDPGWTPQHVWM